MATIVFTMISGILLDLAVGFEYFQGLIAIEMGVQSCHVAQPTLSLPRNAKAEKTKSRLTQKSGFIVGWF
jgi:hypothetical protein